MHSAAGASHLAVDVVSDVVCPWCYIGKRKLERALAEVRARETGIEVVVRWHPFELNPDLPVKEPNTRDAHRLIAWAQQAGDAEPLVEHLFRAYFIEGRQLTDAGELTAIAEEAGFPRDAAQALLASERLRTEVEAEYREAQDAGITGVPFFIFNGRTAVSGAHDPPALLEAIAAARAPA